METVKEGHGPETALPFRRAPPSVGDRPHQGVGRHVEDARAHEDQADELILLVDSSKFEASSGSVLCALSDIDRVVADSGIAKPALAMLEKAGVEITMTRRSG